MKIAICDDDILFAKDLENLLRKYFSKFKISGPEIIIYDSGEVLLQNQADLDIVFLDILMPGLSGIIVGNELKKQNPHIMLFIVTSCPYSECLDETMDFHVFRYLPKPMDQDRLFKGLKEALRSYHSETYKILIEEGENSYVIKTADIIYIETDERKTIVHTTSKSYCTSQKISELLEKLPKSLFFQTYRSYIVNFQHVSGFNHEKIYLCNSKYSVYLTRRKYTEFRKNYLLYLGSVR